MSLGKNRKLFIGLTTSVGVRIKFFPVFMKSLSSYQCVSTPLKLIVVSPDAPQSMNNSLKPSLSLPCTVAEKINGIIELIILPQCLVNRRTEI